MTKCKCVLEVQTDYRNSTRQFQPFHVQGDPLQQTSSPWRVKLAPKNSRGPFMLIKSNL